MTKRLSAVVRSILENLRTLGVWAAELAMYRIFHGAAGEPWHTRSGALEAVGFVLLFVGTLSYKNIIRLPCASLYDPPARPRIPIPPSPYMAATRR